MADCDRQLTDVKSTIKVPVAFVIETQAEFHDHFKHIMVELYNSLKEENDKEADKVKQFFSVPDLKSNNENPNIPSLSRCLKFTQFVSQIAFLRTVPAPVFNSEVNLMWRNLIKFKEMRFDQVPEKNNECIRILIDCLDFKTILTCMKALMFDLNLIVFSSQTSLLFNVVEALKQLMFPFTFDSKHFLPANDTYKGANGYTLKDIFIECVGINAIFAIKTNNQDCTAEDFMQFEDAVILDIDISLAYLSPVNSTGPLPRLPDEFGLLRSLNAVKNKLLPKYDLINPNVEKEYDDIDYIPSQIRHTFR